MAVKPELRRRQQSGFRMRFEEAMQAKGLTNREVAALLGVAESTITGYRRYGSLPDADVLFNIPDALDVSLDWLLLGRGDRKPAQDEGGPSAEQVRVAQAVLGEVEVELQRTLDELGLRWSTEEATRRAAASLAHERKTADEARAAPGRRGQVRRGAS